MKMDITDLLINSGFVITCSGMPFLLQAAFEITPLWSIVMGFPLGYVMVMLGCALIALVAHCIGPKSVDTK